MIGVGNKLPDLQGIAEVSYAEVEGKQFSVKSIVFLLRWTHLLAKEG